MKLIKLIILTCSVFINIAATETQEKLEFDYLGEKLKFVWDESESIARVSFFINEQVAGEIEYHKLQNKNLNWYYITNLYIKPEYRNLGYVQNFSEIVLVKIILSGAKKIFAQPFPFEKTGISQVESKERLPILIHLYKIVGFKLVSATKKKEYSDLEKTETLKADYLMELDAREYLSKFYGLLIKSKL